MSRFAVQTIAWGPDAELETMIGEVKAAGYEGIELFQHPDRWNENGQSGLERLVECCHKENIHVVGISADSFEKRCDLVREYCLLAKINITDRQQAPYVYCDEWKTEKRFTDALKSGLRIALHPHMYKPVQTMREVDEVFRMNPTLLFLPDTAHLTIAGDNPVEAIGKYFNRLAAVHVKDWIEEVGRSFQFYARGFCELNQGGIPLTDVLDTLARRSHRGWIVVEQDTTPGPHDSAKCSLDWLRHELWERRFKDPELLRGM